MVTFTTNAYVRNDNGKFVAEVFNDVTNELFSWKLEGERQDSATFGYKIVGV